MGKAGGVFKMVVCGTMATLIFVNNNKSGDGVTRLRQAEIRCMQMRDGRQL